MHRRRPRFWCTPRHDIQAAICTFVQRLDNLGYVMASLGFVVLMPDYVGLGESELQHPYCHAQSESDAGWQLVQSLVELSWELDVQLNGNLYVTGYSQGGHGAMAMARSTMPVNLKENCHWRQWRLQWALRFERHHFHGFSTVPTTASQPTFFTSSRDGMWCTATCTGHSLRCAWNLMRPCWTRCSTASTQGRTSTPFALTIGHRC